MKTVSFVLSVALTVNTLGACAEDFRRNSDPAPSRITLGAGFEFSSGDYGSGLGDTNAWYVPFSLGYAHDNWRFKLTIPYINSTGPGNVISAGGDTRVVVDQNRGACTFATIVAANNNNGSGSGNSGSGSGNSGSGSGNSGSGSGNSGSGSGNSGSGLTSSNSCTSTSTTTAVTNPLTTSVRRITESGLGDVSASAIYSINPIQPWMPYLDVGAKIKFPTADQDRGLGTGAYDYTMILDLYKSFGKFAALGGVAYTFKGDIAPSSNIPSGLVLNDVLGSYVGAEYRVTNNWLVGISGDYKQASSPFARDVKEFSSYATWRFSPQLSVTGTVGTGFTDATPNYFAGLALVYGFNSPL